MSQKQILKYYVEGENEKKIVEVLRSEYRTIKAGKVEKLNITCQEITKSKIMQLKWGTIVVVIFDTDRDDKKIIEMVEKNLRFLRGQKSINDVICIMQVDNLEDELIRSCNIKHAKELTGSKSKKDFKSDMLHISNLKTKLEEKGFDQNKFWNSSPKNGYNKFQNESSKIKCHIKPNPSGK